MLHDDLREYSKKSLGFETAYRRKRVTRVATEVASVSPAFEIPLKSVENSQAYNKFGLVSESSQSHHVETV